MQQKAKVQLKKNDITLPVKVSKEEYADIQRAKLNSKNPMQSNSEWYREVLLSGLKNKGQ